MLKTETNKKPFLSVFTYFFLRNITLFLLLISIFTGATRIKSTREKIHVKRDKDFIETYVNISQRKIRVKSDLTYYWYKSRSINSTKGGYAGQLLDGKFDRFNLNKILLEQGQFKKGIKNGFWRTWHKNGELKSVCKYRRGLKHGTEIIYSNQGIVTSEVKYSRGNIKF